MADTKEESGQARYKRFVKYLDKHSDVKDVFMFYYDFLDFGDIYTFTPTKDNIPKSVANELLSPVGVKRIYREAEMMDNLCFQDPSTLSVAPNLKYFFIRLKQEFDKANFHFQCNKSQVPYVFLLPFARCDRVDLQTIDAEFRQGILNLADDLDTKKVWSFVIEDDSNEDELEDELESQVKRSKPVKITKIDIPLPKTLEKAPELNPRDNIEENRKKYAEFIKSIKDEKPKKDDEPNNNQDK